MRGKLVVIYPILFVLALILVMSSHLGSMNYFGFLNVLVLLLLVFRKIGLREFFPPKDPLNRLFLMFAGLVFLSHLVNQNFELKNLNDVVNLSWIFSYYIFLYLLNRVQLENHFKNKISWVLIIMYMAQIVFYFWADTRDYFGHRFTGFFENPNTYSHSNMFISIALVGLALFGYFKRNLLFYFCVVISAVLSVLALTRSVWLALAVSGLYLFIASGVWRKISIWISGLIGMGIVFYFDIAHIKTRYLSLFNTKDVSTGDRILLWKANWQMFLDHPIFGMGFNENIRQIRKYYDLMGVPPGYFEGHPHNMYLNILAGTGLVGMAVFIYVVYQIFKTERKINSQYSHIRMAIYLGVLAAGVGECNFDMALVRYLICFTLATMTYELNQLKTKNQL